MVGILNKIRRGLDWIGGLSKKYGVAVDAFTGLPISQVVNKVLPVVSTGLDIANNSYDDYKADPKSFSLGGWLSNVVGGKYLGKNTTPKMVAKKPVVYKRPEDLHPRIELNDEDMVLATRQPSGVEEVD